MGTMVDAVKNYAYSTVATGPSPSTSGPSLVVQAGDGAKFPATPFTAAAWPSGQIPLLSNAELLRVSGLAGDTFTFARAQEGTSAQPIVAGYQIAQVLSAGFIAELEAAGVTTFNTRSGVVTLSKLDVTSTGLSHSDVGADASGAAAAVAAEIPVVSTSVTGPDAWGASPVAGSSGKWADGAHDHGLIAAPAFYTGHTYVVSGNIGVPSGATNYVGPFYEPVFPGNTKTLVGVKYSIRFGTSVSFAVKQNGSSVSGLGSLSATTTPTTTSATIPPAVAHGDAFDVVVSAVSGSPDNLTVSFFFEEVA